VPLSDAAIADLQHAGGGYFSVSALLRDREGDAQRLPVRSARQRLMVTLSEPARLAAA
jgi:hypothetical protein